MVNYKRKSDFFYLAGKTKYYNPTMADKWNKWSHLLYPDTASLELLRDLQAEGLKNVIKKDDDGYFLRISRPVSKQTSTGKMLTFLPPETFNPDGTPFVGVVGHGSDVTTKIEVYSYMAPGSTSVPGKAMRWVSTRIDNLVPFNPETDMTDEQREAAEGLLDQPQKDFF